MPESDAPAPQPVTAPADPNQVPITHSTAAVSVISDAGTISMNFIADRMGMRTDGSLHADLIVVARLRFDLSVAKMIRDQLDAHISGTSKARDPNQKLN